MAVVVIFSLGGKTLVWPPYVLVKPGEEVVFKCVNTCVDTEPTVTIFLPRPDVFAVDQERQAAGLETAAGITLPLSSSQPVKAIRLSGEAVIAEGGGTKYSDDSPDPGIYPYAVYCGSTGDFAVGNSTPVMIIEPPGP